MSNWFTDSLSVSRLHLNTFDIHEKELIYLSPLPSLFNQALYLRQNINYLNSAWITRLDQFPPTIDQSRFPPVPWQMFEKENETTNSDNVTETTHRRIV